MDFFSHILFGVLTATLAIQPFNFVWVIFAGFMAGLPDFDVCLAPLNKIRKSFYFQHRGGSHSVITAVVVVTIFAGIFTVITSENFLVAWGIGTLFYCLHLGLDTLTTYRTPVFYPILKTAYKFDFERAVNPVLMFVSLGINLFLIYSPWTDNTLQVVLNGIAVAYFAYLAHRIVMKFVMLRKAAPGTRFFPGTLPLVYYTYQRTVTDAIAEYQFMRHVAIFRKTLHVYHSTFQAGTPEFEWVARAKGTIPDGRFFGSWNCIIPVVETHGDRVQVKMIYAEAYMRAVSFCVTVEFDRETKQVINVRQAFERLKPALKDG